MNYALEHNLNHNVYLTSTPRKKTLKSSLITVHSGIALIKLGKNEYAVENGESFWIPFDCLTSVTYMPDTQASVTDFSVRLRDNFPSQSGFVALPKVTNAAIEKLATVDISKPQQIALLEVIRFEITEIQPELRLGVLSKHISSWTPDQPHELPKEMHLALKVREARKRLLSGTKRESVIDTMFNGSEVDFEQISRLMLGSSL